MSVSPMGRRPSSSDPEPLLRQGPVWPHQLFLLRSKISQRPNHFSSSLERENFVESLAYTEWQEKRFLFVCLQ